MKLTLITENNNLVQYLRTNPSIIVENVYTDLGSDYDRFINDLNQVDVLLLVDYSDLTVNLSKITLAVQSGNAYLLNVKEIVIVSHTDLLNSPTSNAKDKFAAFADIMKERGYKMRLVQNPSIEFHGIYEAIIQETALAENDVQVYDKYKVYQSSGGVDIKSNKAKRTLAPDRTNERPGLVKQDKHTRELLGKKTLLVPDEPSFIQRTSENVTELDTIDAQTTCLVVVTGVKYSGKSTFCIRSMQELHKNGFNSLCVDSSGRRDLARLLRFNNADFPILTGSEIFIPAEEATVGIQLMHPSPTASFMSSLTHLTNSKTCVFCEVDVDYVQNYLSTYLGKKALVVVTEYDFVKLRDISSLMKNNEFALTVVVNTREPVSDPEAVERTVRDFIPCVESVGFITDMVDSVSLLGVC